MQMSPRQRSRAQQLSRRVWLSDGKSGLEWEPFATVAILASPAAAQPNVQHQPAEPNPWFGLGCTTSVCFWVLPVIAGRRRTAKRMSLQGTWRKLTFSAN